MHDLLDAPYLVADLRDLVAKRVSFAVVKITVDREQETRLCLAEAVDHAVGAEVGRGRGPDRAEAGGGQHRDYRFRHIGDIGGDAIARIESFRLEPGGNAGNLLVELPVSQPVVDLVLGAKINRDLVISSAQQVFGEVEVRIREPLRLFDIIAIDQDAFALVADDAAKIPDF